MGSRLRNVTFSLPEDVVEKLRSYVEEDYISSLNSGVREALEQYTTKLDRIKFKKVMEQAAQDPLFIKDVEDSMKDFEKVDYEIIRGIEE
jgi:Arc/MetJ-type ribon-helix-helix transcriptional regulator